MEAWGHGRSENTRAASLCNRKSSAGSLDPPNLLQTDGCELKISKRATATTKNNILLTQKSILVLICKSGLIFAALKLKILIKEALIVFYELG